MRAAQPAICRALHWIRGLCKGCMLHRATGHEQKMLLHMGNTVPWAC